MSDTISVVCYILRASQHTQGRQQSLDVQDEEIKGRDQWYIARFVADDAPDWNAGQYLRTEPAGPNHRTVIFEAEVSRERVPLRSAYKHVGQRAAIRVNSGPTRELTGMPPSFPGPAQIKFPDTGTRY